MSTPTAIAGIDELLNEKWGEHFTFDRKLAKEKGIVILCWATTGAPLPLNIEISDAALEKGHINWRELHRKIKLCLPDNIIKQRISEINSLMRNANRRALKDIENDYKKWLEKTGEEVRNVFGVSAYDDLMSETPLSPEIRRGTIQALHAVVDDKINRIRLL